jgi:type I restriction enzyme, S subunit
LTADWRDAHPDASAEQLYRELIEGQEKLKSRRATPPDEPGLTSAAQLELLPCRGAVRLGDILDVGTGATPLRKKRVYYENGTIPWVTSGAVNAGMISLPTELITQLALEETNVKLFPPGTLLIAVAVAKFCRERGRGSSSGRRRGGNRSGDG